MPATVFFRERAREYAAAMIARFLGLAEDTAGRVTDFNVGSNIRSFFEAIALRLEHLDGKLDVAIRRGIPGYLFEFFGEGDGITTTVGFPAIPALPARGTVRFVRTEGAAGAITIPAGFRLTAPQGNAAFARTYVTSVDGTMADGASTLDLPVESTQPGTIGSTPAQTLRLLDTRSGIASATNIAAMVGTEAEPDERRRLRFAAYIRNLARSQFAGLEVGALAVSRIAAGSVVEAVLSAHAVGRAGKRGLVDVFVDNGAGNASAELVADVQDALDGGVAPSGARIHGYKAAGAVVVVRAVTQQVVPITVAIRVDTGYRFADVQPVVATAIEDYLVGLGAGVTAIEADLVCAIAQVPGVADMELAEANRTNVVPALGARIMPGVVTVTENPLL